MKNLASLLLLLCAAASEAAVTSYALVADAGRKNDNAAAVRDSILRSDVRSLVMAGDNLYETSQSYPEVWDSWRDAGLLFDVTALGNHTRGYAEEMAYFGMPAENFSVTRFPGTRFIVLNSDNKRTVDHQMNWLRQELESANEPAVFLVYHHPTYTISSRHAWTEKKRFQEKLRPMLMEFREKITALLIGHDHLATIVHFGDLPALVSGATQDPKKDRPVNYHEGAVHVRTEWLHRGQPRSVELAPFWARMDVDSQSGETEVHYIDATSDQVACSASIRRGQPAKLHSNCRQAAVAH